MVNFYRRFVPNAADVMEPLFKATSGNPKPNADLEWTHELSNAFTRTKNLLTHATALNYPVGDAPDIIDNGRFRCGRRRGLGTTNRRCLANSCVL